MFTFSFKIDNDNDTLTEYNGMSIKDLSKLLNNLSKALPDNGKDCTLYEISGNCYNPKVACENRITHDVYVSLIQNIANDIELPRNQIPFRKSVQAILKKGHFCEAYDTNDKLIATISNSTNSKKGFKYSTEIIYGIISEIGGKSLERTHIVIFCNEDASIYTIPITKEQDIALKDFYKDGIIKFEVLFRYSPIDKRKTPSQLLSFKPKSNKTFFQLANEFTQVHGDIIEGTHTFDKLIENRRLNNRIL